MFCFIVIQHEGFNEGYCHSGNFRKTIKKIENKLLILSGLNIILKLRTFFVISENSVPDF
ncbi:hypothetical protein BpHYR1_016702 [Brachionus plicatilis]|uniref:Uncharacterized protein n=1 Tax=Brachionus plicatilis TaxID=10195 RepID=A0A3M7RHB5_BRAPC|nr:hypothetical protein BpHYR1_016702 [Brachionus plicatilis]